MVVDQQSRPLANGGRGADRMLSRALVGCALALLVTNLVFGTVVAGSNAESFGNAMEHLFEPWHFQVHNDSWRFLIRASQEFRYPNPRPLYPRVLFYEGHKFQYPPTSLLITEAGYAIERLFEGRERSPEMLEGLNLLSWLAVFAIGWSSIQVLHRSRCAHEVPEVSARWVQDASVALLVSAYAPLLWGYELGQVQTWLDALFAVALAMWLAGAMASAGMLLGLSALVKPQAGLVLLWGLVRGERRFALGFAATAIAGLLLSIALFGVRNHWDYLFVLSFIGSRGEAYAANQSLNGLLNRLLHPSAAQATQFALHRFPDFDPRVYWGTALGSIALVAFALRRRPTGRSLDGAIDLSLVLLAATLTAPIVWEHHYGFLIPVYALIAPPTRQRARPRASGDIGLSWCHCS